MSTKTHALIIEIIPIHATMHWIKRIVGRIIDFWRGNLMLSPLYPEFIITPADAENAYTVKNVTRRCKECGKPFGLISKEVGQRVCCPECHTVHIIKKKIEFSVVIEQDPEITPEVLQDFNKFVSKYRDPSEYSSRVLEVIEMASRGCTIKDIKDTVKMSQGNIGSAKRWGRARGLC